MKKWFDGFRSGQVFVSNGPLLRCEANDELPGHVFKAAAGEQIPLRIDAMLDSRDQVAAVEIIKNGHVERSVPVAGLKFRGKLINGTSTHCDSSGYNHQARNERASRSFPLAGPVQNNQTRSNAKA